MTASFDKLLSDLDAAASEFSKHNLNGALQSFQALIAFLQSENVDAQKVLPLAWLASSFNDAMSDEGKKPFHEAHTWAFAAAGIDLLKQTGMDIQEAARAVARASGQEMDAAQITEFRKNCRKGRVRVEASNAYHWCIVEQGKKMEGLPAETRRKAILQMIGVIFAK